MANQRNALGRGLNALLQGPAALEPNQGQRSPEEGALVRYLPLDQIDVNPEQPRRHFDEAQLDALAASIRRHGVIQPVVVRRVGERYELQVGERRWRASQVAGLKEIPALIADIAPADRLLVALIENIQRNDLNPIELALSFVALRDRGLTQEEIGERVGMERSSIANHIRLLDLSRPLQEDVEEGRISMGHAKVLLSVNNLERRLHLRNKIVSNELSVRNAEQLARQLGSPQRVTPGARGSTSTPIFPEFADLLRQHLKTRIRLIGSEEKGRIEINYSSAEDLRRIGSLLLDRGESK